MTAAAKPDNRMTVIAILMISATTEKEVAVTITGVAAVAPVLSTSTGLYA